MANSCDIAHGMPKSIDEQAVVFQNKLHYWICLQALCYNLPRHLPWQRAGAEW